MRFAYLFAITLISGLVALAALAQNTDEQSNIPQVQFDRDVVFIKTEAASHWFTVEVANTGPRRQRGLMYRRTMPNDAGMIFYFPNEAPRHFWMKNTYIPLDIIYIDAKGEIVNIAANTETLSETPIPSILPAKYVLEINAGQAAARGIEIGDILCHPVAEISPLCRAPKP
jgi:uncharacterized membrane protein (UPF0127 family)